MLGCSGKPECLTPAYTPTGMAGHTGSSGGGGGSMEHCYIECECFAAIIINIPYVCLYTSV